MRRIQKSTLHFLVLCVAMSFGFAVLGCGDDDDDDSSADADLNDDTQAGDDDLNDDVDDDANDDLNDDVDDDSDDDLNDDIDDDEADWKFIRDEQGRALIYRGCNFDGSAKGDSGLPRLEEADAVELAERWGFNFARYLIFWSKVEPEPGVYGDDYLDDVEERLDWMADNDIAVVLDMHQDIWGVDFHSGSNGAPSWATITDDWPDIDFAGIFGMWAADYISPAVMRAFDNFWDYATHPELQDHYAAMWVHVVKRFKDHPAVIGYDFMNEPWQGTSLLRFVDFDQNEYSDFLQRMIDAVRAVDSEGWIYYEPCAFATNQGIAQWLRVLSDPREGAQRLVYFPHLYPMVVDLMGGYYPEVDQALANWEQNRIEDGIKQRAPVISGEWAMLQWLDRENLDTWTKEAMAMFDRVTSGWAYWDCNWFFNAHDDDYRAMIASVYPRAVAGTPTSYGYDLDTRIFTLEFDNYEGAQGPTEIYFPADREYPQGWMLDVSDPGDTWNWEIDEETNVLSIWTNTNEPAHTVTIRPAELH